MKLPSMFAIEIVTIDVIEDTFQTLTFVSEVEATAVYEPSAGPEQPQQGENSAPPEVEGPELRGLSE